MNEEMGTQENPLKSAEPMKLASDFLGTWGLTENEKVGLLCHRGTIWRWLDGRWEAYSRHQLKKDLLNWAEDLYVESWVKDGDGGIEMVPVRLKPTPNKMEDVLECVEAKASLDDRELMPIWVGTEALAWDTDEVVAFKDLLINVRTGETMTRGEEWFDPAVLPVDYRPDAKCERWMQCLKEWGGEDENWAKLLQRIMGYCLLGHKDYERWALFYGKIRAGKGTILWVIKQLVGPGFISKSLDDLVSAFGLDGLEKAKVLSIPEASELRYGETQQAARVMKNVVGRDPMSINIKYVRQLRDVVVEALPIVQSNEIPKLSNKGGGLSGKMLTLPFEFSFLRNEDFKLKEKLGRELEGIAVWALKGAMELEAEENPKLKWPEPKAAAEAVKQFHMQNNMFDYFLDDCFVPDGKGFVTSEMMKTMFDGWVKKNELKVIVPIRTLIHKVLTESSWDVKAHRMGGGGNRGVLGVSIKWNKET